MSLIKRENQTDNSANNCLPSLLHMSKYEFWDVSDCV